MRVISATMTSPEARGPGATSPEATSPGEAANPINPAEPIQTIRTVSAKNLRNAFSACVNSRVVPAAEIITALDDFDADAIAQILHDWEVWARDDQLPPPTREGEGPDWNTWLILGGRGAGKTRAGAEWIRAQALGKPPFADRPAMRDRACRRDDP